MVFGRVGKAADVLGSLGLPETTAVATSKPTDGLTKDEIQNDILFFMLSGRPGDRAWATAYSEVQRVVALLDGGFLPLRPDSPRGLVADGMMIVSFFVPVKVRKGQQGKLPRERLLELVVKSDPVAGSILKNIEEGKYDK
jgi:hypothetical protein